jgi:hypothetical protein
MSLEFLDSPPEEFMNIFDLHFPEIPRQELPNSTDMPIAILRFKAGTLNSRKSMITPFLPRLV